MKILHLIASNVKRLQAVEIRPSPDDSVVILGGDNGAGKTSVLDAIMMALAGSRAAPTEPVRRGASSATVEVDLGELQVKLRLRNGRRELEVTGADGTRQASPQALLDRLYSRVTFDPVRFLEADPDKQAKTLRAMVGADFSAEDDTRAQLYAERTAVGRELKHASERLTAIPREALSAPAEEVNIGELVNRKSRASAQNQRRRDMMAEVGQLGAREKELAAELERVRARLAEIVPYVPEPVDTSQLDIDLAKAEETNRAVRARKEREALSRSCRDLEDSQARLTKSIEDIDAAKARKLAEAPWPVPGLGFAEDGSGITMNGLPFEQASAAEKLRVSLAMGAALNPKLRVLLIRDGSLLDPKSMALVRDFATKHDMQVWIERVGDADPGAVIIEDGRVRVESPEPFGAMQGMMTPNPDTDI